MPFKNIAKYGYQQTVAGDWDMGNDVRMTFGITDPDANRFNLVLFGPTTPRMREEKRMQALTGYGGWGPTADDTGAALRPQMTGRGAGAIAIANLLLAANAASSKPLTRIVRSAFALGAPMYHGSNKERERKRETIEPALEGRDTRGLGDLSWVARHYRDVIDRGPYFIESGGRRWWEAGFIAIPQSVPAAVGSSATIPTDVLLRVRTDLAGKTLYLQLYATRNHQVIGESEGVFQRPRYDVIYNPDDVQTIEAWQ
jgi:hypothetical protein